MRDRPHWTIGCLGGCCAWLQGRHKVEHLQSFSLVFRVGLDLRLYFALRVLQELKMADQAQLHTWNSNVQLMQMTIMQ